MVFDPLSRAQIRGIADIQLQRLRARLADRDLSMTITDAVMDKLGEAGFDPVYGARPLKRAIQQLLENPLAQRVLAGDFVPGDTLKIDLDDQQQVTFKCG